MKCIECGGYFRQTKWNNGATCESCADIVYTLDGEEQIEVDLLQNPSGKTQPVFYDELGDDSFGL